MDLATLSPGTGLSGAHVGPVAFLVLLAVCAVVWSAVLFVLARALVRRLEQRAPSGRANGA